MGSGASGWSLLSSLFEILISCAIHRVSPTPGASSTSPDGAALDTGLLSRAQQLHTPALGRQPPGPDVHHVTQTLHLPSRSPPGPALPPGPRGRAAELFAASTAGPQRGLAQLVWRPRGQASFLDFSPARCGVGEAGGPGSWWPPGEGSASLACRLRGCPDLPPRRGDSSTLDLTPSLETELGGGVGQCGGHPERRFLRQPWGGWETLGSGSRKCQAEFWGQSALSQHSHTRWVEGGLALSGPVSPSRE